MAIFHKDRVGAHYRQEQRNPAAVDEAAGNVHYSDYNCAMNTERTLFPAGVDYFVCLNTARQKIKSEAPCKPLTPPAGELTSVHGRLHSTVVQ